MTTVLGISGSLRKGSYNSLLLRAAQELAPEGMVIETYDIAPIPLYNNDVEVSAFPPAVKDLQDRIRSADALLIVSPEYHHSISGVMKNAIDWASRLDQPLRNKPTAVMGAGTGPSGTRWGQMAFRQVCQALEMICMNRPEVYIADAPSKFDEKGSLVDEPSRTAVKDFLLAFASWIDRVGK